MTAASPFRQTATSGQGGDLAPAGTHPAVLVGLIDLGTHEEDFQGKKTRARKVLLVWELTAERLPGTNRNQTVGRSFTLSGHKKSGLRQFLESWRGRAFPDGEEIDPTVALGKSCYLALVHKTSGGGNTYAQVDRASMLPKGAACPPAQTPPLTWWIGCGRPTPEDSWIPYVIGQPVKDWVEHSDEWRALQGGHAEPVPQQPAANGQVAPAAAGARSNAIPMPPPLAPDELPF